jgi:hypothetical protein
MPDRAQGGCASRTADEGCEPPWGDPKPPSGPEARSRQCAHSVAVDHTDDTMQDPHPIEIATVGSHRRSAGPGVARLYYSAPNNEWSLWWPCERCAGTAIPLLAHIAAADLAVALARMAAHIAAQPCPACLSAESRTGTDHPLAWYDTAAREWVVRVPGGPSTDAVVPLGIRWYDVPRALINIAAARVFDAGF